MEFGYFLFICSKIFLNRNGVMQKAFVQENIPFCYSDDIGKMSFDEFIAPVKDIEKERCSSLAAKTDDTLPVKLWIQCLESLNKSHKK